VVQLAQFAQEDLLRPPVEGDVMNGYQQYVVSSPQLQQRYAYDRSLSQIERFVGFLLRQSLRSQNSFLFA
jgi:hypothetical protein